MGKSTIWHYGIIAIGLTCGSTQAQAIMANFPYKSELEAAADLEQVNTTSTSGLGALHARTLDDSFTSKVRFRFC